MTLICVIDKQNPMLNLSIDNYTRNMYFFLLKFFAWLINSIENFYFSKNSFSQHHKTIFVWKKRLFYKSHYIHHKSSKDYYSNIVLSLLYKLFKNQSKENKSEFSIYYKKKKQKKNKDDFKQLDDQNILLDYDDDG